jgi:hypothetical protein
MGIVYGQKSDEINNKATPPPPPFIYLHPSESGIFHGRSNRATGFPSDKTNWFDSHCERSDNVPTSFRLK